MATIVDEIGTMASDNVSEILEDRGTGVPAGPSEAAWSVLSEGGWGSISADDENGMELRDIQEVARATGRFAVSTPVIGTLLAGRWFDLDDEVLERGVAPLVVRDDTLVAPYAFGSVAVVDDTGVISATTGALPSFADLVPLGTVAGSPAPLSGEHLAEARAVYAAVAIGCADAVMTRSVDWAQTRTQFGRPIKDFQAVRHMLADMHIAREQAWTAAIAAAHEGFRAGVWAAQAFALARTSIELGIQVHGGVGFTWEVGLQHHLDQVLELDSLFGGER